MRTLLNMKDATYALRLTTAELDDFVEAVHRANNPDITPADAIRELMRWYAGGMGKLHLAVPMIYPKQMSDPILGLVPIEKTNPPPEGRGLAGGRD